VESEISSDHGLIREASKLILPGVGSFDQGMKNLEERKLISLLNQKVLQEKTPVLGICLGMQLMTHGSEEGSGKGLAWVDAQTIRFNPSHAEGKFPVPHMGWEYVTETKENSLMQDMPEDPKFYFAHSYYVKCANPDEVILSTDYILPFDSGLQKEHILGVQFHPEKSHRYGMQLLSNFNRYF
jgi:glutamine amidotransferase